MTPRGIADHDADEHGETPELEGGRQALQNDLHRGVASPLERHAEVALKRVPEKGEVLLVKGAIEAPVPYEALDLLLRCIIGKKGVYRASRQVRETEDDERDGEQCDQGLQKADCEETSHVRSGADQLRRSGIPIPGGRGRRARAPLCSGLRLLTAGGYSAAAIRW